jgi:NAD(P)-dependent dehydrogenase (short-subunit alcohol dehydrogenase family)
MRADTMKKVVLVTGASSGIGKETAILLARKGYIVYAAARRIERMEELKKEGIHLLEMDVTVDASMTAGMEQLLAAEGRIDGLINNAGYGSYGALEDVPLSEARYQFDVNIFGMARLIQLALPAMRKQGNGRIINISSIAGRIGQPHGSWYHASKFAVEGLSDSLRMEVKQFGIDVVIIRPGAIVTEWNTITREHLLQVSGNSAYRAYVLKHLKMMESADKHGSPPAVVAKTIVRAMQSSHPRTRYATGGGARLILFLHGILSDRMSDKLMTVVIR